MRTCSVVLDRERHCQCCAQKSTGFPCSVWLWSLHWVSGLWAASHQNRCEARQGSAHQLREHRHGGAAEKALLFCVFLLSRTSIGTATPPQGTKSQPLSTALSILHLLCLQNEDHGDNVHTLPRCSLAWQLLCADFEETCFYCPSEAWTVSPQWC